jgi:hypothetical protein
MSFRMTATMMSLCGLPLALSLSRKAMNVGLSELAQRAAMNRVSRRGFRPPAMLARFIDEPLLQ